MKPTTRVYNYIRGALRGAYGVEDFRGKSILIVGVNDFGQDLVSKFSFDSEIKLYFQVDQSNGLQNYLKAFTVCTFAEPWGGQPTDITVDTLANRVTIKNLTVGFQEIGEDPYTQGIHDFYL